MIKAIYNAKPRYKVFPEIGFCQLYFTINDKIFYGESHACPNDMDFFSEKVGLNIALSRARITALNYFKQEALNDFLIKYQLYIEAPETNKTRSLNKLHKANRICKDLNQALKRERKWLNDYLEGQDKAISSIKRNRARTNQDN